MDLHNLIFLTMGGDFNSDYVSLDIFIHYLHDGAIICVNQDSKVPKIDSFRGMSCDTASSTAIIADPVSGLQFSLPFYGIQIGRGPENLFT